MRRYVGLRWLLPKKMATILGTKIRANLLSPEHFVHHPFVSSLDVALLFSFLFLFLLCSFHLFFSLDYSAVIFYLIPFFLGCSATGIKHPSHCSDRECHTMSCFCG
ncbi:hypothetical protein BHE74_00003322 [Ensete ventricosum]|nr:hypothetical protein BHE74_00003322 [Ensete ventricosum]